MSPFLTRAPAFAPVGRPLSHEFAPFMNLFNDTFNELQKMSNDPQRSFSPRFDVKESQNAYTLEGELPGIDQKDISIEFSDENVITIKGRTERRTERGRKPEEATEVTESSTSADTKEVIPTNDNKEVTKADENQHHYWVSERTVGEFARSFSFPAHVDQDNVKASLKNGILYIVIPKLQKQDTKRRIHIQ